MTVKICVFMAIYKRASILEETIRRLKSQTLPPCTIVAVGSCDEDREVALRNDLDYLEWENKFLSTKVQAAVLHCRQYNPDAIMGIGSDDWPSENWVEEMAAHLDGNDIVGPDHLFFCLIGARPPQVIRYFYPHPRYGEPMGVGRLVLKRILDRCDWKLYPPGLKSGLDGASHRRLMSFGAKSFLYKDDKAKILCPKGLSDQLTSWNHGLNPGHSERVKDPAWIETYFPGVMEKGLI
jgi:glycosyltransferase involved in cell wall biosynthesis